MFLQYYLTEGHTQNLLIDTINEKLYYLPKALNSLEQVVHEHTDYQLEDYQPVSMEQFRNQWLEVLEVELNFEYLENVYQLAENSLADFLFFRVSGQEDLERMVADVHLRRDNGTFSLRQICLVVDFDFEWKDLPEDPSGFLAIVRADEIASRRCIALQNLKAGQEIIIQSLESNVFFEGRLYIDAAGYIKPHAESSERRFHITDCANKHKELVADDELTRNWKVTKDQIQGCKLCEYRNICIDADSLVRQADGSFRRSKPCAYDPVAGSWQAEVKAGVEIHSSTNSEQF